MIGSTQDYGWMHSEEGVFQGISLGHGGYAEHDQSIPGIRRVLGVKLPQFPVGLDDRLVTETPSALRIVHYAAKHRDKRRKPYQAALLILEPYWEGLGNQKGADLVSHYRVGFHCDEGSKWFKPEVHNMEVAWDGTSFAVHVRGDENIARLKELFEAFQRKDIAVANPRYLGFMKSGPSFVIASRVPAETRSAIEESDKTNKRIGEAVIASGIEEVLKAAGKGWYALSPDWYCREREEGLILFLNPREQSKHNSGWFTLDELRLWATNEGPVMADAKLKAFDKEHVDWSHKVLTNLGAHDIKLRVGARLEWMDQEKQTVGIRIWPAVGYEAKLPEGLYEYHAFMERYAVSALETA